MGDQDCRMQAEILDLMPERVVRFSLADHSIVYCNPAWARGHGAPVDALLGRRLDDVLTAPEIEGLRLQLERLESHRLLLADPDPLPASDDPSRWVAWRDQLVADGREVLAIGRDVTERHRAEQELTASEARFRDLADRATDVVFHLATSPQPHFTYLSPAVERFLGSTAEELEADFSRLVGMLDDEGVALVLAAMRGDDIPERFDMHFRRADGHVLIGEIQITLLPNGLQGIGREVTEVRALQAELAALATRDPLTGLVNRRLLDELLRTSLNAARRNGTVVTIAVLDLDDFKAVNDAHGHQAGDKVLVAISERLLAAVRQADVVARVGGDEFVLVLDGDRPTTDDVIERVRIALAQPIELADGTIVRCPAGIGRASTSEVGWGPAILLAAADAEMYETKRNDATSR
ncbi:MAG: diguanylate cyclase [Microthrixaceae bacterium]